MSTGSKVSNTRLSEVIIRKIIVLHYWLLNALLKVFAFILFPGNKNTTPEKIIIFRTGSLGDSVCALPAINSIRKNFPEAKIDILTNAGAENLVSLGAIIDRTIVDEIINYYGLEKAVLFKMLKRRRYDLFIQLPQYDAGILRQIRDMFIAKAIRVRYGFGWRIASTWIFARYQSKFIRFENERERLLGILEKNGLKSYSLVYPLGFTQEIRRKTAKSIKESKLDEKALNIGIVVGAKRSQNRWPIGYFKEVAKQLLENNKNILIFGGPEDYEIAEQINGENVFNYCGKLSPLETAEMMKYCKLVISNDTGPMHLAYAVGTPVIAIFSGRDYAGKWFPPAQDFTFRNQTIVCADCLQECKKNNECLLNINPTQIITAVSKTNN